MANARITISLSMREKRGGASLVKKEITSKTHEDIINWVKKLKFKKKLFGGVDEEDVLKKIWELNGLYEKALLNERARYDALLKEYQGGDTRNDG